MMTSRPPKDLKLLVDGQTDFVLHKSQLTFKYNNVIDFTEQRLIRLSLTIKDAQQKMVLMALLSDYIHGLIAVAWKRGLPTYVRVTKNA
jgi:hypothetical protein